MAILIIDEGIQGEKYVDLTTDEMRNEVLKVLDDRIIQVEISKTPLQKKQRGVNFTDVLVNVGYYKSYYAMRQHR